MVLTAIAFIAAVISRGVTSAVPSARLGPAGSSDLTPRLRAMSMTRSTPTCCTSCSEIEFSDWANAVRSGLVEGNLKQKWQLLKKKGSKQAVESKKKK